ncbi:uncharacterized protein STEHIDRAFT_149394 [Stereum hirsutum FP-91666 SS1]|uniref:uncharacterized protein n=1 Tax=Stereum hirsutum (strain FP-91666) TaxID=721885 RepID=UPI000444A11B|nr:uncharacterized protein STEHIDRAFT_149394 [Stereum hirsutum FP-91666 SS1]EIM83111.1 hypothetical protein STEHIDRAFT_149394 [Stereum hirsutum FP-91666 SS1]
MSSLKRKLSSDGDTSNEDDSRDSLSTLHHHKRRRSTTLERDLASLSLSNVRHGVASSPVTSLANYQRSESPLSDTFMDTDVSPSRETPMSAVSTEEAIPEVKMSSSSWYEPEKDRIVVTDLDGSSSDEEDGESTTEELISPAVREHLMQTTHTLLTIPRPLPNPESTPNQNQALVLFNPDYSKAFEGPTITTYHPVSTSTCSLPLHDDDAMEIEM